MAKNLTPEQFEQACKNAIVSVQKNIGKILVNATNLGSAEMQFRVFNKGRTTAGNQMRYRSAPYKRLRTDAGLQTNWKDLIFTGDLFYSLSILGTKNNEVVYGFNNAETAQIAEWQETSDKQVNEPIFDLSASEIERMEKQFARDVSKVFIGALEAFPAMPGVNNIGKSATEKSIERQQRKARKNKRYNERKNPSKTKLDKRNELIEQAKKQKLSADISATKSIKDRINAKKELKSNVFSRKNLKTHEAKLKQYISKRNKKIKELQLLYDKKRKGTKLSNKLKERINKLNSEVSGASNKLSQINRVKQARKQITQSRASIKKSRESYSSAVKKMKKARQGLREIKRIDRAKRLRQGTYKPKKRKKK